MISVTDKLQIKIDELMAVLDLDVEHLKQNLSFLSELRALVVKRDNNALEALLKKIRSEVGKYEENEADRKQLRQQLADIIGCEKGQVTLSKLEKLVTGEKRQLISEQKSQLSYLVKKLAGEHKSTVLLLGELARFNRLLLDAIFERSHRQSITYNSNGAAKRHNDSAFVSFHL